MSNSLFNDFEPCSAAAWKQKIQADLKGADYNETLLWHTDEGIVVKPFYTKEDRTKNKRNLSHKGFNVCQSIFIDDEKVANTLALDALQRGANAIYLKANKAFDFSVVLKNINSKDIFIYFDFSFLDSKFITELANFCNSKTIFFQTDIIGNLAATGNWFTSLKEDHIQLEKILKSTNNSIAISGDLYQNAGANITQQLAYSLAHANEYLLHFGKDVANKIHFKFALGSNYFFEIAKLRAFRILWETLLEEYEVNNVEAHIFSTPSYRNKTLYDYNVNMLRTTSESMSAILGGANTISNIAYDAIYHKSNEFGERISRNQLLILKEESHLQEGQNIADGTYYIESITHQLAEKALHIFKEIEKAGGFLKQLKEGTVQKKIKESSNKEATDFKTKKKVLLGTNLLINKEEKVAQNLELYPFVKQRNIKTLITPIIKKRLSESIEEERLAKENE